MAAALEACRQASPSGSIEEWSGSDVGVYFATSTAGMPEGEVFFEQFIARPRRPRLRLLASHTLNGPGDAVARVLRVTGPVQTLSSACASGALAIAAALDAVRSGEVAAAVAGGSDSLCKLTYSGFNALRAVDARPCRPFRSDRAGLSLGEGSGVLCLETLDRARARGAVPLVELLGAGASCDAHHMTAPLPGGEGAAVAMNCALHDASIAPGEVQFINAHGTGTHHNDVAEGRAIQLVFPGDTEHRPLVTATKGSVGHLLGSAGAIEAVATIQCIVEREVHATPGSDAADAAFGIELVVGKPCPLSGLPRDRDTPARRTVAISTSFGFGGANAALVLASYSSEESS
jgi:3-oxoacyl-[acyl-carrier-protein] synthase II